MEDGIRGAASGAFGLEQRLKEVARSPGSHQPIAYRVAPDNACDPAQRPHVLPRSRLRAYQEKEQAHGLAVQRVEQNRVRAGPADEKQLAQRGRPAVRNGDPVADSSAEDGFAFLHRRQEVVVVSAGARGEQADQLPNCSPLVDRRHRNTNPLRGEQVAQQHSYPGVIGTS
jgi:hypothetical protein